MTTEFHFNPQIEAIHQEGVRLANNGEFDEARSQYFGAIREMGAAYPGSTAEQRKVFMPTYHLHEAMVLRDNAWLPVLRAAAGEPSHIDATEAALWKPLEITDELIQATERYNFTAEAWGQLLSEHGATVSLNARHSIARAVLLDNDLVLEDDITEGIELFHSAHGFLERGSNRYFRTSNAVHAARAENINHNPQQTFLWIGRAAASIGGGVVTLPVAPADQRHNLRRSMETFVSRLPSALGSHTRAITAVRQNP